MSKKLLKRFLYPMLFIAIISLPLYFFTVKGLLYDQNHRHAVEHARMIEGEEKSDVELAMKVLQEKSLYRPPIDIRPIEDRPDDHGIYFSDAEGNDYQMLVTEPRASNILSYLLIPLLVLCCLAIAFTLYILHRIKRDEISPIQSMVAYLDKLLSGGFTEDTNYPEIEEDLVSLLGSEKQKTEFKEALMKVRQNETMRRQFSANVSHELKSPLTSINGYAEMIESGMAGPEDTQKFASIIHREGVRLLNMINEIIQLSKFDTGYSDYDERTTFSLTKTIKEEIQSLAVHAENRNVDIHFNGKETELFGNARLLTDVVRNLLSNAIKYSKPEGGEITVDLEDDGEWVEFSVEDNGLGISPEDQARVFERFYVVEKARTKSQGSGTGLGLSLVKHTLQSHGGKVTLKSRLGMGSKFTVTLPKYGMKEE